MIDKPDKSLLVPTSPVGTKDETTGTMITLF